MRWLRDVWRRGRSRPCLPEREGSVPSIRDLNGEPIEEEVSSRVGVPSPPMVKAKGDVDVHAVRKGIAAVLAKRGQSPQQTWTEDGEALAESFPPAGNEPVDVALHALEASVQDILLAVQDVQSRIAAIRATVAADAEQRAAIESALKVLRPILDKRE